MSLYKEGNLVLYTEGKNVYLLKLENCTYNSNILGITWRVSLIRSLNGGKLDPIYFKYFDFIQEDLEPLNDEKVMLYEI